MIAAALLAAFVPPSPAQTPGDEPASEGRQLYDLGLKHQKGEGMPRDLEKANEFFLAAGEAGYGRGYSKLASNFEHGLGVEKDIAKALSFSRRACELGDAWGYYNLGIFHSEGTVLPLDFEEANRLYRKAGEMGCGAAWVNLGFNYLRGRGVSEDHRLANDCFAKAGDLGNADGVNCLARSLEIGRGLRVDRRRCMELYVRAAEMGSGTAAGNLGVIFLDGKTGRVERELGLDYLRKGAERWNTRSALRLVEEGIRFAPSVSPSPVDSVPESIAEHLAEARIHFDLERFDEAIRIADGIISGLDQKSPEDSAAWMQAHAILGESNLGKARDLKLIDVSEMDRLIELSLAAGSKGLLTGAKSVDALRSAYPNEVAQLLSVKGAADASWCSTHQDYVSIEGERRWTKGGDLLGYAIYLAQDNATSARLKLAYAHAHMRAGTVLLDQELFEEGLNAAESSVLEAQELPKNLLLKAQVKLNLGKGLLLYHQLLGDLNSFNQDFVRAKTLVAEGARTYEQLAPGTQMVSVSAAVLSECSKIEFNTLGDLIFDVFDGLLPSGSADDDAERQRILRGMDAANRRAAQQGLQQPYPGVQ